MVFTLQTAKGETEQKLSVPSQSAKFCQFMGPGIEDWKILIFTAKGTSLHGTLAWNHVIYAISHKKFAHSVAYKPLRMCGITWLICNGLVLTTLGVEKYLNYFTHPLMTNHSYFTQYLWGRSITKFFHRMAPKWHGQGQRNKYVILHPLIISAASNERPFKFYTELITEEWNRIEFIHNGTHSSTVNLCRVTNSDQYMVVT